MPEGESALSFVVKRGWLLSMSFVIIAGWFGFMHCLKAQEKAQDVINKVIIESGQEVKAPKSASPKK